MFFIWTRDLFYEITSTSELCLNLNEFEAKFNVNPHVDGVDKNTSEMVYCLSYEATKRELIVRWRLGV